VQNQLRMSCITTACVFASVLVVGGGSTAASAASTSGPEIKLGVISAETGADSPNKTEQTNAIQANVDQINAAGGINGHKVEVIIADDTSTAQGALTAAQNLVSQGIVGVMGTEPSIEGPAEQYLSAHNIPISYPASDAGTLADPNLYSPWGYSGGNLPASNSLGKFLKGLGVSKMAGVAWGAVPIAVSLVDGPLKVASQKEGVQTVLNDLSPTVTTTDFTSDALKVKSSGAQGIYSAMDSHSLVALAVALHQQGAKLKAPIYVAPLYEQTTLTDPNEAGLEGSIVQYWFEPNQVNTPAMAAYKKTMAKYAPGDPLDFSATEGYIQSSLLLQGLQGVHGTATPQSLGAAIKKITNFTGQGLIAKPLNFTLPKSAPQNLQSCFWYLKIKNAKFVPDDQKPICG
jgi:branched-chain amino acid transport system substrate-binding protein